MSSEDRELKKQIAELAEQNASLEQRLAEMERQYLRLAQHLAPSDTVDLKKGERRIMLTYVQNGENATQAARVHNVSRSHVSHVVHRPHCKAWLAQAHRAEEWVLIHRILAERFSL